MVRMWYDIEVRFDLHGFNINVKKNDIKDGHHGMLQNNNITFKKHCEFTMASKMAILMFIMNSPH